MIDRELMQQALDVMLAAIKAGDWKVDGACDPDYVLEAIRARLEQPKQEPVACPFPCGWKTIFSIIIKDGAFLARSLIEGEPVTGHQREIVMRLIDYAKTMASHGMTTLPQREEGCAGRNCGSTDPNLHSAECFEDYEKATGMAMHEPVANIRTWRKNGELHAELWNWDRGIESLPDGEHDLYTAQPQREWQGLTDEERYLNDARTAEEIEYARAIEAKLKEKNT